jgi:hypothetical protein
MKEIKNSKSQKVVPIDGHRSKKQARDSLLNLLQDTRATARAIEGKTCLLCMARKLCVNKTGLCAACYGRLSSLEKQLADSEAAHKIITISVSDDRWPGNDTK